SDVARRAVQRHSVPPADSPPSRQRRAVGEPSMPSNRHPDDDLRTPPQPAATPTPAAAVRHAMSAVYVVFIGSGLAFASWASRIPQVRDRLEVTPAQLGLLLWCIAVGSVIAMPLSGLVVS